jgi:stage V sporulation protein R
MFAGTNRKMLDEMANHASRVRRYMERYGVEAVEGLLDRCLSLDNLIDYASPSPRPAASTVVARSEEEEPRREPRRLRSKGYMESYINPPAALEAERARIEERQKRDERFPARPERDVMLFLLEHAPLKNWERDVLGMVREEAYYFAPQGRTKVLNEGWACLAGGMYAFSDRGIIPMRELYEHVGSQVYDGAAEQRVCDRYFAAQHATVTIRTRRGLVLCGSDNHRVLRPDGEEWTRLDVLQPGDRVRIAGGGELWSTEPVRLSWRPERRPLLQEAAEAAGVCVETLIRYRKGRSVRRLQEVQAAAEWYDEEYAKRGMTQLKRRRPIRTPSTVDENLASFLGYMVGDGHISRVKRGLGLTTADDSQAERFVLLARELFRLEPRVKRDGNRWRVLLHSQTLADFLVEAIGLTTGPSAREKRIPDVILRSPEPVVRAFLRAYFDCDGYAGPQGVILSTASEEMSRQVQLVLLNYGILSHRREQRDGCRHVHVSGASAARFAERIGFGLERKQTALEAFVAGHRWFKEERWEDEVVSAEHGAGDVYDVSVTETHRYAAGGFINHNSYWHSTLMTTRLLTPAEVIDYADHHSGTMATSPGRLNPYKLGIELWRDIEERWNKGRHGAEWEQCDDFEAKQRWDTGEMRGREKIFEVRRHYNDVTFIDEFLTADFVRRHGLFTYEFDPRSGQYVISDRDFHAVKEKLLFMMTNFGQPTIEVVDANHANRGELVLAHRYEGVPLKLDQARETLENVHSLWRRPVHLETCVEDEPVVMSYDGVEHGVESRA